MGYCVDAENEIVLWDSPYSEIAIFLPIFTILQLMLLIQTLYHEYTKRNDIKFKKVSLQLRISYIVLQIFALWWVFIDVAKFMIDPFTSASRKESDTVCDLMAWSPKVIPMFYYFTYVYQVTLRLYFSFQGSFLALSRVTILMLLLFIFVPILSIPPTFLIANKDEATCIGLWKPNDFPSLYTEAKPFTFCSLYISVYANIILIIGILIIAISNIVLGSCFAFRLNKLLSHSADNKDIKFKFKGLIVKNSIMTLTGAVSTVACYMLWVATYGAGIGTVFLYADLFINCIVIGLMFKYNERNYKRLCGCCIRICLTNCDKSQHSMKEKDVERYLNNEVDLTHLSDEIGSSSLKRSTFKSISNVFKKRIKSRSGIKTENESQIERELQIEQLHNTATLSVSPDSPDSPSSDGNDDERMLTPPPQNIEMVATSDEDTT